MKKRKADAAPADEAEVMDDPQDDDSQESNDNEPSEMLLEAEDEDQDATQDDGEQAEDDLTVELAQALEETRDQLLRARAEFDNYRKRVARDSERVRKMAAESLLKDLLPVADNFERALQHGEAEPGTLFEGIKMVHKQFVDVLARHGVEPIPAIGQPFDPNVHDALSRMPSDEHSEDTVALEYEKGYRLGDVVLRPAKVVVSSGPSEEAGDEEEK